MSIDNDLQTSTKLTEDDVCARILSARSTIDDDDCDTTSQENDEAEEITTIF